MGKFEDYQCSVAIGQNSCVFVTCVMHLCMVDLYNPTASAALFGYRERFFCNIATLMEPD